MLDSQAIKKDFPIFEAHPDLIYLDSTATTQKPRSVIEAVDRFSRTTNANVHRGIYRLAEQATDAYEGARAAIAAFLGAEPRQLVFTRNATEAINLVAYAWGRSALAAGDTIVLTQMEHHSNIVPWQILAKERGLKLAFIPITADGRLDADAAERLITRGVKLVALTQMSNVLGTRVDLAPIIARAHAIGTRVLVDGAQAAAHFPVNVSALGADFYAFSGHKMLGPFGSGGLIAKPELLESMPPFLGGGDMIREVSFESSTWNDIPYKFEAGTPDASAAVGLGAAVAYLQGLGMDAVWNHERGLAALALERLDRLPGVKTYGPRGKDRGGVVAFTVDGIHPHDIASMLDEQHIAIRAGHHCAQPLLRTLGLKATARASFSVFSVSEDVEALVRGLETCLKVFG